MKGTGRPERAVGFRSSQACGSLYELLGGMSGCGWAPLQAQRQRATLCRLPCGCLHASLWVPVDHTLGACRPACRAPRPVCGHDFRFGGRESIFKICHSKSRQKFQNLDPGPDSTRTSLHGTRWVYEGGREA